MSKLCWFGVLFNLLFTLSGLGFSQEPTSSSSSIIENSQEKLPEANPETPLSETPLSETPLSDEASKSQAQSKAREGGQEVNQEANLESKAKESVSSESSLSSSADVKGESVLEVTPKPSGEESLSGSESNLNGAEAPPQSAEVKGPEKIDDKEDVKAKEIEKEVVTEKLSETSKEVQEPSQELEQTPPPSSPVYYSPVSRIDMAKQKPVYADKGDGSSKFGTWMISVGSGKADLTEATYYKEFYGSFANTLDFGVDWFFFRHTYGAAGVGGRVSYYTDKGSRQTRTGGKAPGGATFSVLSNVLTLQGVISPLPWHWIVFKGWAGRQYDSFEDTRDNDVTTAEAASSATEAPKLLVSKGKRNGTVKGISVLFNISFLDSRSIKSMKPTLGIDSLYIAPFKEYYEQKSVTGLNLTRNLSGVMLVFGSAI